MRIPVQTRQWEQGPRAPLSDARAGTFFKWKRNPATVLPKDTLERISYILGIYKGAADPAARRNGGARMGEAPEQRGTVRRAFRARAHVVGSGRGPVCGAPVPRRAARRRRMTPSVVCVEWKPCWRIVPSRFPPIQLFERVADPDDLAAVFRERSTSSGRGLPARMRSSRCADVLAKPVSVDSHGLAGRGRFTSGWWPCRGGLPAGRP